MCADADGAFGLAPGKVWYRKGSRESEVVLDVVTWDRYLPDALVVARLALADEHEVVAVNFGYAERAAVVQVNGALWVVFDEGVAVKCGPESGFALPVHPKIEDHTLLVDLFLDLTTDEVLDCRTGEQINLANFIATGSQRHEENFDLLNAALSEG